MAGGTTEAFALLRPLLEELGSLVVHVGEAEAGQAAKLCNNLMAGATMAAIAEACAIASREGIAPGCPLRPADLIHRRFALLLHTFPGRRGRRRDTAPTRASSRSSPWALMAKDLDIALELAAEHGVEAPVASASRERYRDAQEQGLGGLDYSAVYAPYGR